MTIDELRERALKMEWRRRIVFEISFEGETSNTNDIEKSSIELPIEKKNLHHTKTNNRKVLGIDTQLHGELKCQLQ